MLDTMKSGIPPIRKVFIATGGIIITLGILFHLQGLAIVGPESSFMYANEQWLTNGIWIAIAGVFFLAVGIKKKSK